MAGTGSATTGVGLAAKKSLTLPSLGVIGVPGPESIDELSAVRKPLSMDEKSISLPLIDLRDSDDEVEEIFRISGAFKA